MDSVKSIVSFKIKKGYVTRLSIKQSFFHQFVNNFSALLLCDINFLEIFDIGGFFQTFFITRSTEIVIELNFWLGIYVPYILEFNIKYSPILYYSNSLSIIFSSLAYY